MSVPFILLLVGILTVVGGIIRFKLHAFLALTLAALVVGLFTPKELLVKHFHQEKGETIEQANKLADKNIGTRLAEGFGRTSTKIGILIAMAAIIGTCLMESGVPFVSCAPFFLFLEKSGHRKPSREVVFFWGYQYFLTLFSI